jgi:phenylpropionate dioxygenase-like ring-hydroxylating dioxygenase large terminal subunit
MTLLDPVAAPTAQGGELLDDPVFRRFWFPVARADALDGGPISRSLLGEELVIWSPAPDIVSAAYNRCPHRDARLSTGWLETCGLVCPYHGWAFGEDGSPTRIPQMGDATNFPPKASLRTNRAAVRYGWIWVTLDDDPLLPIPDIPEYGADGWRTVSEPESDWDCTATHLIDNNIDPGHIAYVHQNSFGTPTNAEVDVPEVTRNDRGMLLHYEVEVESRPGEVGRTVRNTNNQLHGPFLMMNRIVYPDGVVHLMVKACTPATSTTTHQLQMVLRNDSEAQRPAADIIAFDDQVWAEDKAVLEHCWTDFRTELTDNVHLRTDKASIEYRRWLGRLVAGGPELRGGAA